MGLQVWVPGHVLPIVVQVAVAVVMKQLGSCIRLERLEEVVMQS
jgi:hypothetical protein